MIAPIEYTVMVSPELLPSIYKVRNSRLNFGMYFVLVFADRVTDGRSSGETITVYSIGAIRCESHVSHMSVT